MTYTNFEIGQTFPLPIRARGDGGLFQIDANGVLFILQLSHTDIIAIEAFRTGKMEFALCEEDGVLFLLYQIDGIFKEGWGDAPLSLYSLTEEQRPNLATLDTEAIHLYLVDPRLHTLLAMRTVKLNDEFRAVLRRHIPQELADGDTPATHAHRIATVYARLAPQEMRDRATAVLPIPLDIQPPKPH